MISDRTLLATVCSPQSITTLCSSFLNTQKAIFEVPRQAAASTAVGPAHGEFTSTSIWHASVHTIDSFTLHLIPGLPSGANGKEPTCQCRRSGFHPGLRRSSRERDGYPLQYPCLETPTCRGAWRATVQRAAKSQTRVKRPSVHTHPWGKEPSLQQVKMLTWITPSC